MQVELYHVRIHHPWTRFFDVPIYDVPILRAEWENKLRERYKDRRGEKGPYVTYHRTRIIREVDFQSEWARIQQTYVGLMGSSRMWEVVYSNEEDFRKAFERAEWTGDEGLDPEIAEAISYTQAIREKEVESARRMATAFLDDIGDMCAKHRDVLGKDRLVTISDAIGNLRWMTQRIGVSEHGVIAPAEVVKELEAAKEAVQPAIDHVAFVVGPEAVDSDDGKEDDGPLDIDDPSSIAACEHIKEEWLDAFLAEGMTVRRLAESSVEEIDDLPVRGLGKVTAMRIQEWAEDQVDSAAVTEND